MRSMRKNLKTLTIIALVLGFFFAPVLGSVNAMSYNYDFWKNIIPSAEGIAHQDTYYATSFEYFKQDEYEETVAKLNGLLDGAILGEIKESVNAYSPSTTGFDQAKYDEACKAYNNAIIKLNGLEIEQTVKQQIKDLISKKQELESDVNLYKKLEFTKITDIQVYGDKVYVLTTPGALKFSNITGTASIADSTQLVIINNDMKWEALINEFEITESVRNQLDNYYQWNRLSFADVATGNDHTIAVDRSGNLWAWGDNTHGQLGLDPATTPSITEPYQITWIGDGTKYTNVYAVGNTSFALDTTGKLWGFGVNTNNLISSDDSVTESYVKLDVFGETAINPKHIAIAKDHAYAIASDSKVYAWGKNKNDILQVGETNDLVKAPTLTSINLLKFDSTNNKNVELKATTIYAGAEHTIIVDDEGYLWTWGANTYGQLGLGHNETVKVPTEVVLKKNNVTVKVETASVGDYHTVVIDQLGGLWTYGSNSHYQLGFKELNGKAIDSLNTPYAYHHEEIDYTHAFAFGNSTYAVDLDAKSYVFGENTEYQLGFESEESKVEYTTSKTGIAYSYVTGKEGATYALDSEGRLWISGVNSKKLGFEGISKIVEPKYSENKLQLKNISIATLENSDIYKRAVYVAHSQKDDVPAIYLRGASGVAVDEEFIYIADTQNSRIVKINKANLIVEDVCLTPANSTFKQLNLDSSIFQASTLRQFKPTKITVSPTGRVYAIAEQVYEGIIEFNKQGDYNRYLGQNDVVANPLKELLRDYLTDEQLASFALTLPPLFTSISTDSKGFIYATSYPDTESGSVTSQNMVKAINTSGKDCMKRNGYVTPNGDAVYISSSTNANAILGPSYLVDVTINKAGNFTVVDEVRGRLFTYDSDGNLLYIAGEQPGGTKQGTSSSLSSSIIKPVAIDYLYRSYIDKNGQEVNEEIIIVADQQSKSLMYYETTEFGRLVNQATAAYTAGVDTAEKAEAVRAIWEEVRQRNTNYELAYLGIGKCLLVESDYVATKDEQLELYQEAMANFKLAHSGTYYSKAFGRYRDQVLKDNFSWIMTGAVVLVLAYTGFIVYKTVKKRQAKKIRVEGGNK